MARLNEPIVATDSIETLRRKFLRQNRDIARVNSTQSLRIRSLENECARILSENLHLRGQILRLETELQESRAQRIADHALEIKEKMEAQLLEWGTMLASLGHEPIPKNRSPRVSKKAKIRPSLNHNSPPQWRRRDTREVEAAALQEGRLPPLWENKPCPRETMNSEEILALRSEAAEATESPDLGPPPVSRFVDEDPVKIDLPTKTSPEAPISSKIEDALSKPFSKPERETEPAPTVVSSNDALKEISLTAKKMESAPVGKSSNDALRQAPPTVREVEPVPTSISLNESPKQLHPIMKKAEQAAAAKSLNNSLTESHSNLKKAEPRTAKSISASEAQTAAQIAKANLKRKTMEDDEKENSTVVHPFRDEAKTISGQPENNSTVRDHPASRPIKELPSIRRDARGKLTTTTAAATQRKPLAVRNANEVVESPKKASKPPVIDEVAKTKAGIKGDGHTKDRIRPTRKESVKPVEIPIMKPPVAAPIATTEFEPEPLSVETLLSAPQSPVTSVIHEVMLDTPPPTDISSRGETTRGSRRAKSAVSYAEPNLRDKMRRPTKQLFDAVSGEGKSMRRTSHSKGQDGHSSAVKSEEKTESWKKLPMAEPTAADATASPLAQKSSRSSPVDDVPISMVTERKKRDSSISIQGAESETATRSTAKSANRRLDEIAAREAEAERMFAEQDVYDFPSSSPNNDSKRPSLEEGKKVNGHLQSRSRRLSSVVREDLAPDTTEAKSKGSRASGPKKRASMMAPKKSSMEAENIGTDCPDTSLSSADGDALAQDRVSMRRKSTML